MSYVLVRHRVEDYGKWRSVFNRNRPPRREYGIVRGQVFRGDNAGDLLLLFEVEDVEKAQRYFNSRELWNESQAAGVIGKPEIHFLERLEEAPV